VMNFVKAWKNPNISSFCILPFWHSHKFSMNLCAGNIKFMAASIVKFRLAEDEDIVKVTQNFHEKLKEVRSTFGKVNVATIA